MTYGTIDKHTSIFRGQFAFGDPDGTGISYYVEDAKDYGIFDKRAISILYSSEDAVRKEGVFEPAALPM